MAFAPALVADSVAADPASVGSLRTGAEAARFGVLRRLGPALKHDMVVNLQALAMMAEVMSARLERGSPAPAEFHTTITKMSRIARDAVANCLKVAAWIEPQQDEAVRLATGIEDCLGLLGGDFNFRGVLVKQDLAEATFLVSTVVLRNLLIASLITLTDSAGGPCVVEVKSVIVSGVAEISVHISPRTDKVEGVPMEPSYRKLDWADVQSLASAESVDLERTPGKITMRIPRVVPTAPLQIAPV